MTIALACLFDEGAVLLADSRATWETPGDETFQDNLQKIVPLDKKQAFSYAGDVRLAARIIKHLQNSLKGNSRYKIARKLAAYIPRVTKHYYNQTKSKELVEFIFAGISSSGKIDIWSYKPPHFHQERLLDRCIIIGSGEVIEQYVQEELERINNNFDNLKNKADALIVTVESALDKQGISNIGGGLQVITMDSTTIRPLSHGFMDINPDKPGPALSMTMKKGTWTQTDEIKKDTIQLLKPHELLNKYQMSPKELRVRDFKPPEKAEHNWYLTYFLTCIALRKEIGNLNFVGVGDTFGSPSYPQKINLLAAIGLWGVVGKHQLQFRFVKDETNQIVKSEQITIEYFPEEIDLTFEIEFSAPSPGLAFIECWIENKLLARRPLCFDLAPQGIKSKKYASELSKSLKSCEDKEIEKAGKAELTYSFMCQNYYENEMLWRFEGQIQSLYCNTYPLNAKFFIASALRMPKGENDVRVELMNAASREVVTIVTAKPIAKSSCTTTPVHGEQIVNIPKPGIYFFNTFVNDYRVASNIIAAENEKPMYSYSLLSEDIERVKKGGLFILLKRTLSAKQNKHQ